ncbi:MAG: DUF4340 domain-containing protein [Candidatus Aminicenantes bacterium]|nr:DUF4340 domain-containing protein [Candidatus Aminicenantes bacterium]
MKFKTTLVLLAVFLVIFAFIFIFENKLKTTSSTDEKLVDLSSEDIQSIILNNNSTIISFTKDEDGEWTITTPLEAKADKYEVDRLAEDFSDLKIERIVEEQASDLEKYGIPQKEITLVFKGGKHPVKILMGMENPLDHTLFAKRDDEERVVLIPGHLKSLLDKDVFGFRQKDIFKFQTDDVNTITLKAKNIQWSAIKKDEEWFLEKPVYSLAKNTKLSDILYSLSNIKAKEFISEEKKNEDLIKYGLNKPQYQVKLLMPLKNQEVIFFLQKEKDKVYATTSVSPKIIAIDETILTDLEKEASDLRENKVANFYTWRVKKLRLIRGDLDFIVVKDDENNWQFESPPSGKIADNEKIETFIRKIETLEASNFIDPPLKLENYVLDHPKGEIQIWTDDNEGNIKEVRILIGSENTEQKKVIMKNSRFDYLFEVNSDFLEDFPKVLDDWEKKQEEKAEDSK